MCNKTLLPCRAGEIAGGWSWARLIELKIRWIGARCYFADMRQKRIAEEVNVEVGYVGELMIIGSYLIHSSMLSSHGNSIRKPSILTEIGYRQQADINWTHIAAPRIATITVFQDLGAKELPFALLITMGEQTGKLWKLIVLWSRSCRGIARNLRAWGTGKDIWCIQLRYITQRIAFDTFKPTDTTRTNIWP